MQQGSEYRKEIRRSDDLGCPDENANANKINEQNVKNVKNVKRSNKFEQALNLPTLCNINPRSIYNKINEFHEFVKEEEVDVIFISEILGA